jgi:hypothetical protein
MIWPVMCQLTVAIARHLRRLPGAKLIAAGLEDTDQTKRFDRSRKLTPRYVMAGMIVFP